MKIPRHKTVKIIVITQKKDYHNYYWLFVIMVGWGRSSKKKTVLYLSICFYRYDFLTREQTKQNKDVELHDIDDYVERVKNTFGENSKQYLVAKL